MIYIFFKRLISYSFNNDICSNGTTKIDDKSAKTASTFCNVLTFNKFSFRKISIARANNGITSKES